VISTTWELNAPLGPLTVASDILATPADGIKVGDGRILPEPEGAFRNSFCRGTLPTGHPGAGAEQLPGRPVLNRYREPACARLVVHLRRDDVPRAKHQAVQDEPWMWTKLEPGVRGWHTVLAVSVRANVFDGA
jgi:hypothetical protein